MSLVVLTGAARSGKSRMAEDLAIARDRAVVVAVAGWGGDEEMDRRIEAHRLSRPDSWSAVSVGADPAWLEQVPGDAVLLLDCLGTLISNVCFEEVGQATLATADAEERVAERVDALLVALLARSGDSIIVTNEVGWGVVPEWASARLFRDELGRANRRLSDEADSVYLIVAGRCLDLATLPKVPKWPL